MEMYFDNYVNFFSLCTNIAKLIINESGQNYQLWFAVLMGTKFSELT